MVSIEITDKYKPQSYNVLKDNFRWHTLGGKAVHTQKASLHVIVAIIFWVLQSVAPTIHRSQCKRRVLPKPSNYHDNGSMLYLSDLSPSSDEKIPSMSVAGDALESTEAVCARFLLNLLANN